MPKKIIFLLCVISCLASQAQNDPTQISRECLSKNKDWLFYAGDIPLPIVKGHDNTYMNGKAGKAGGAAAPGFDDSQWRKVTVPHDSSVEGGFDSTQNLSQGYRKRGIGWYRRRFKLDSADAGKHLELQFGAIAIHATIWINGTVVHRNWCGYNSFYIDIKALAKYGKELYTIAIRVDANDMEGWWYEGAAIYRHVWLVKRSAVHITTDGLFAQPVKRPAGSGVWEDWLIPAEVTIENTGRVPTRISKVISLLDNKNREIAKKMCRCPLTL